MIEPADEGELAEAVREAARRRTPLRIRGGGTRSAIGRPVDGAGLLSTAKLAGITLYEPGALTLVARAGTPLAEVDAALVAENQHLPFEPPDFRALLGSEGEPTPGGGAAGLTLGGGAAGPTLGGGAAEATQGGRAAGPTLGGATACGWSGPRRIQAGALRDSLIGVRVVTGEGMVVKNGGRVMKNVTGYDLVKLMAGAWGTLGVLTELSFKLLPRPQTAATLVLEGLDDEAAGRAMRAALASPYDVTGAAHDPAAGRTLVRLEGLEGSVRHRASELSRALAAHGAAGILTDPAEHAALWRAVRDVSGFAGREGAVWRLSVRPTDGPVLVGALRGTLEAQALYDWGGGLVWLLVPQAGDCGAAAIRQAIARLDPPHAGGHATLVRASAETRAAVPVFQPQAPALAALETAIRARFDPAGILNPGLVGAEPSRKAA